MNTTKLKSVALAGLLVCSAISSGADLEMWEEPSHQLVFNKNGVRVLDIRVAPGLVSHYHSHRFATVYVVIQDAKIKSQRTDADWFDLSNRDRRPAGVVADRSDYAAKPYTHRVHVVDDRALHLVAVLSERDAGVTDVELTEVGQRVNNQWFEEHRVSVAAGEASDPLSFDNEVVVVQYDSGARHIIEEGVAHSWGTAPGAFSWHPAGTAFQIANDSSDAREYVLIEVKGAN